MGGNLTTIKRENKIFLLYDYEKEEKYLAEMHANGWHFVETSGRRYTFEKGEPEQMIYRIDFSGIPQTERDDYYAMFSDYGWEYMQDINGFSYFRKPAEGVKPEDLEIFSDGQSRIDMMNRILTHKMIPLFMLMLLLIIPQLIRLADSFLEQTADGMDITLCVLYLLLAMLYSVLLGRCVLGWLHLKKKYQNGG